MDGSEFPLHVRNIRDRDRAGVPYSAPSDMKKLMTPQPPPAKKSVDAGSAVTNLALSKTKWMRDVPSGDESSIVTFSFASLPLTSDSESSAQFTLNCRPPSRLIF